MLKSAEQGTGKTTLNYVMSRIFGEHARTIADKQRLFDRFNADLQTAVFIDADEMLWAGDRGSADALKSLITSQTVTLEVKHGSRWQIEPPRIPAIFSTHAPRLSPPPTSSSSPPHVPHPPYNPPSPT